MCTPQPGWCSTHGATVRCISSTPIPYRRASAGRSPTSVRVLPRAWPSCCGCSASEPPRQLHPAPRAGPCGRRDSLHLLLYSGLMAIRRRLHRQHRVQPLESCTFFVAFRPETNRQTASIPHRSPPLQPSFSHTPPPPGHFTTAFTHFFAL